MKFNIYKNYLLLFGTMCATTSQTFFLQFISSAYQQNAEYQANEVAKRFTAVVESMNENQRQLLCDSLVGSRQKIDDLAERSTFGNRFVKPAAYGFVTYLAVGGVLSCTLLRGVRGSAMPFFLFLLPHYSIILPNMVTTGLWMLPNEIRRYSIKRQLNNTITEAVQKQSSQNHGNIDSGLSSWIKNEQPRMESDLAYRNTIKGVVESIEKAQNKQ